MMSRYEVEIRELEQRLARERNTLALDAQNLRHEARCAAVSPKGLLAAAAVGFLLSEFSRPRRRGQQPESTSRKVGFGGLLGGLGLALLKAQYGSPLGFGRAILAYTAARRTARPDATAYGTPATPADSSPDVLTRESGRSIASRQLTL